MPDAIACVVDVFQHGIVSGVANGSEGRGNGCWCLGMRAMMEWRAGNGVGAECAAGAVGLRAVTRGVRV